MLLKNKEIINYLENIKFFAERQFEYSKNTNNTFVTINGQFALKDNNKNLSEAIKTYQEVLKELREVHNYENNSKRFEELNKKEELTEIEKNELNELKQKANKFNKEFTELLNVEKEVEIIKISRDDFKEGIDFATIELLDFMTE